jgi:hypothetical protein
MDFFAPGSRAFETPFLRAKPQITAGLRSIRGPFRSMKGGLRVHRRSTKTERGGCRSEERPSAQKGASALLWSAGKIGRADRRSERRWLRSERQGFPWESPGGISERCDRLSESRGRRSRSPVRRSLFQGRNRERRARLSETCVRLSERRARLSEKRARLSERRDLPSAERAESRSGVTHSWKSEDDSRKSSIEAGTSAKRSRKGQSDSPKVAPSFRYVAGAAPSGGPFLPSGQRGIASGACESRNGGGAVPKSASSFPRSPSESRSVDLLLGKGVRHCRRARRSPGAEPGTLADSRSTWARERTTLGTPQPDFARDGRLLGESIAPFPDSVAMFGDPSSTLRERSRSDERRTGRQ